MKPEDQFEWEEQQRQRTIMDTKPYDMDQFGDGNKAQILSSLFIQHRATFTACVQGIGMCTITNQTPKGNFMASISNELHEIDGDAMIALSRQTIALIEKEGLDTSDLQVHYVPIPQGKVAGTRLSVPPQVWHQVGATKAGPDYVGRNTIIDTEDGDFSLSVKTEQLSIAAGSARLIISAYVGEQKRRSHFKRRTITNADTKNGQLCIVFGEQRIPLRPDTELKLKPETIKLLQENGVNVVSLTVVKQED